MATGDTGADENQVVDIDEGEEVDFQEISQERALEILRATPEGLTSAEAEERLFAYGPNKLPESSRNALLVYLGYMWNPLSWAMEAAAIIAIALLDYVDFALIVALLFVNATISFVEESNADRAIKALTSALAPKAKVIRDGEPVSIEAQYLVPGDIVVIRLGDIVPADVKVLNEGDGTPESETPLQCDQAALTGESLPVKKFSGNVCFSGSTIKQGERHCVVYATGMDTFFGRAAAPLGETDNVANIQKIMTKIGAMCLLTIGVWVVIEIGVAALAALSSARMSWRVTSDRSNDVCAHRGGTIVPSVRDLGASCAIVTFVAYAWWRVGHRRFRYDFLIVERHDTSGLYNCLKRNIRRPN